jgi:hypothetical protein
VVNTQRAGVIGLTTRRLMAVSRPEMTPASSGGEDAAARPLRLGFRRDSGRGSSMRGHGSSRVIYGRARRVWSAAGASEL